MRSQHVLRIAISRMILCLRLLTALPLSAVAALAAVALDRRGRYVDVAVLLASRVPTKRRQ